MYISRSLVPKLSLSTLHVCSNTVRPHQSSYCKQAYCGWFQHSQTPPKLLLQASVLWLVPTQSDPTKAPTASKRTVAGSNTVRPHQSSYCKQAYCGLLQHSQTPPKLLLQASVLWLVPTQSDPTKAPTASKRTVACSNTVRPHQSSYCKQAYCGLLQHSQTPPKLLLQASVLWLAPTQSDPTKAPTASKRTVACSNTVRPYQSSQKAVLRLEKCL